MSGNNCIFGMALGVRKCQTDANKSSDEQTDEYPQPEPINITIPDQSQLDTVYKELSKELKACQEGDSLLSAKPANIFNKEQELTAKIEVLKYIFNCKQQAAELNRIEVERAARKQHILEVLAEKQENALQNMSEDDLKKMLDELG